MNHAYRGDSSNIGIVANAGTYCKIIVDTLQTFTPTLHTPVLPELSRIPSALLPAAKEECNGAMAIQALVSKAYELDFLGKRMTVNAINTTYGLPMSVGRKMFQAAKRPSCWPVIFFATACDEERERRMKHGIPLCFRKQCSGLKTIYRVTYYADNKESSSNSGKVVGEKRKREESQTFEGLEEAAKFLGKKLSEVLNKNMLSKWCSRGIPTRHRDKIISIKKEEIEGDDDSD